MFAAFHGLRLVTVHPILVHVTLGALPLVVLCYMVAAFLHSERFTFAGDVALILTAVVTLATLAFGLVSNTALSWSGGLGTWRWLHLAFGIGSTALLVLLAGVRLSARRHATVSGARTAVSATAVALVAGFTGWIGGEILVYRGGMAVDAAGQGALALPVALPRSPPKSLVDSMHRIRSDWATAVATLTSMVVEEPSSASFSAVAAAGERLRRTAAWIGAPGGPYPDLAPAARELAGHAGTLEDAARTGDIVASTRALGDITDACAACHAEHRWMSSEPLSTRAATTP